MKTETLWIDVNRDGSIEVEIDHDFCQVGAEYTLIGEFDCWQSFINSTILDENKDLSVFVSLNF